MLRRLVLMRHAKSSWKTAANTDHARPLNARGRRDAPRIAQALLDIGWFPAMVHLSDAQRTQETWALMSSVSAGCPTTTEPALYLAGLSAIRVAAQSWAPEETGPVLVLGHNPGWEQAASTLSGQPITMTTGNAVLLEGQGASWAEALHDSWRVRAILRPRTLDSDALRDKRDPA